MKKILLIILCLFLAGCSTTQTAVQNAEVIPESLRPLVDLNGADQVIKIPYDDMYNSYASNLSNGESIDSILETANENGAYYYLLTKGNSVLRAYDSMGGSKDGYVYEGSLWNRIVKEYLTNAYIRTVSRDIHIQNAYIFCSDITELSSLCMIYYDTNQGSYIYMAWSFDDTQYLLPLEVYRTNMQRLNEVGDFSYFIDLGLMEPYDVHSWSFLMNVWYTPWVAGGILLLVSAATVSIFWFKRKSKPCKTKTQ